MASLTNAPKFKGATVARDSEVEVVSALNILRYHVTRRFSNIILLMFLWYIMTDRSMPYPVYALKRTPFGSFVQQGGHCKMEKDV